MRKVYWFGGASHFLDGAKLFPNVGIGIKLLGAVRYIERKLGEIYAFEGILG